MVETIVKQLGPGFVVPAACLLIAAWLVKLAFDAHTSSRQSRRDFLELWRGLDQGDDMALEVTVRHLLGTYLPATVIRGVLALPFPTQRLVRLDSI
jgi:hypothetical protein